MGNRKAELLQRIASDRDALIDFLRGFIRCPSPTRREIRGRRPDSFFMPLDVVRT